MIINNQGRFVDNPINQVITKYNSGSINGESRSTDSPFNQNLYTGDPISQKDSSYYNDYRNVIDQLHSRTECMNEALESALVPSIIKGHVKVESGQYVFSDSLYNIGINDYVIACNMIRFKSDGYRRLCHHGTIHLLSKGETVHDIIEYVNRHLENRESDKINLQKFCRLNFEYKDADEDTVVEAGYDIDTGVPTTIMNMVSFNYVNPFILFINDRAMSWERCRIATDNIDTFIIFNVANLQDGIISSEPSENTMTYLDIPFKVRYVQRFTELPDDLYGKIPIFWYGDTDGIVNTDKVYNELINIEGWEKSNGFSRIFCDDPNIIYEEFEMDENDDGGLTTTQYGTLLNRRFSEFEYRYKIKRCNMLCFEEGKIREDFDVKSHAYNILRIMIDRVLTNKRHFKIFYNTRVIYDQDNALRIKHRTEIERQFELYMRDVTASVKTFIEEIYTLMKKDIGYYKDSSGNEFYYDADTNTFRSDSTDTAYSINTAIYEEENTILPDTEELKLKYPDQICDQLKIRTEFAYLSNMDEAATPSDQFIYYMEPKCADFLREIASQVFREDDEEVKSTIDELIDRAYYENFNAEDPDFNKSFRSEWFIRKNLPEMFLYTESENYGLDDMSIIDEVFDFHFYDTLPYEENLKMATDYIIGYDADKLEASINRRVVSIFKSGLDLVNQRYVTVTDTVDGVGKPIQISELKMTRWCVSQDKNYVMVFRNGKLFEKMNVIVYDGIYFKIPMTLDVDFTIDDEFEFVFFLNVRNDILETQYKEYTVGDYTENAIACNTSVLDPENVMVYVKQMSDNEYNSEINFAEEKTAYALGYEIDSEFRIVDSVTKKATSIITKDEKKNNMYRISKYNEGEYFIRPSSLSYSDFASSTDPFTPLQELGDVVLCSRRQFRYTFHTAIENDDSPVIDLPTDFLYCENSTQFMIFKNGRIIPDTFVFVKATNHTPIYKPQLYINVPVETGDIIAIFYVPDALTNLNPELINTTKVVNENDEEYDQIPTTGYIRFESPLYGVSSKHSVFTFINGEKIPSHFMEDISNTIIKITKNIKSIERLEIYSHVDVDTNSFIVSGDGLSHDDNKIISTDMRELESYTKPSKLDLLVNGSDDEELNVLFDTTSRATGNEAVVDANYKSKAQLLDILMSNYVISLNPSDWIAKV